MKFCGGADGELAKHEVPQLYQLVFDRGTPQFSGLNFNSAQPAMSAAGNQDSVITATGPRWFQKMERNADGDVSRREFPGTSDQFDRFDADGNDLIDAIEAAADISPESNPGDD